MIQDQLVKAWDEAQTRLDTNSIVSELLGHFVVLSYEDETPFSHSFKFIVWMKVIYDLQRTYLQSSEPSIESRLYLLQPRIVLTTIAKILEKIREIRLEQLDNHEEYKLQRYFAAKTLMSGIRALQLQMSFGGNFGLKNIKVIRDQIQAWLMDVEGRKSETFILKQCSNALLQIIEGSGEDCSWRWPACDRSVWLRDNTKVLYPALDSRAIKVFDTQLEVFRENNKDGFLALFDILWAAEVGHIQWCVDRLSAKGVVDYRDDMSFLVFRMKDSIPESCLELHWHNEYNNNANTSSALLHKIEISLGEFYTFLHTRRTKLIDQNLELTQISSELQHNIESWIRRESRYAKNQDLRDNERVLKTAYVLSCPQLHVVPKHELTSHRNIKSDQHHIFENSSLLDLGKFEIHCPRCPQRTKATLVAHARMIEPLQRFVERLAQLGLESDAPNSHNLSNIIQQSDSECQPPLQIPTISQASSTTTPSTNFHSPPPAPFTSRSTLSVQIPDVPRSSLSTPSPDSAHSISPRTGSIQSREAMSATSSCKEKGGILKKMRFKFPRTPSQEVPKPAATDFRTHQVLDSYCFSAEGKNLILWNKEKADLYWSAIPTYNSPESTSEWNWSKLNVPGLVLVAGGAQTLAVVCKETNQYIVLVYTVPGDAIREPIFQATLQSLHRIINIAISVDGNIVAVGSDRKILIYDIHDSSHDSSHESPREILLGNLAGNQSVDSQIISFSRDDKLVVATRVSDGMNAYTEIILYDLIKSKEIWNRIRTKNEQKTDQDRGLTAVYYNSRMSCIVMTGYTNKHYTLVHSKAGGWGSSQWNTQNGKIQAAVASPSGSQYMLLTGDGKLYELDMEQASAPKVLSSKWNLKRLKDADRFVAMAMPDDDCIYTFRIENNEMILEVVKGKSTVTRKNFISPLDIAD